MTTARRMLRLTTATMIGYSKRWFRIAGIGLGIVLGATLAPALRAQTRAADSLRLRYMRIRAQATDSCEVLVETVSSMGIDTYITPANIRRWIDTATVIAAAKPHRAHGQEIEYAWVPITLRIRRTITDRHDSYSFDISGHGIPILASEIPRIAKLLAAAAAETLRQSHVVNGCPTTPDP